MTYTPKSAGICSTTIFTFLIIAATAFLSACKGQMGHKDTLPSDTAAFGAAHFGMTGKVYRETLKRDTLMLVDNTLFTLVPYFIPDDHRLWALRLISPDQPHDKFNTRLIADMNALIQQMVSLYGGPGRYFNQPRPEDLQPNQVEWYCLWNYAHKEIRIGIAQLQTKEKFFQETRRYVSVCQIVNKSLQAKAHAQLIYLDLNPSL